MKACEGLRAARSESPSTDRARLGRHPEEGAANKHGQTDATRRPRPGERPGACELTAHSSRQRHVPEGRPGGALLQAHRAHQTGDAGGTQIRRRTGGGRGASDRQERRQRQTQPFWLPCGAAKPCMTTSTTAPTRGVQIKRRQREQGTQNTDEKEEVHHESIPRRKM